MIDLIDEVVEVYRRPARGAYREIKEFRCGQRLTVAAFPSLAVRVADILG